MRPHRHRSPHRQRRQNNHRIAIANQGSLGSLRQTSRHHSLLSEPISDQNKDLLDLLVEGKVISQAQASLVRTDHEATGMTFEEILVARSWVSEAKLGELAPKQSEITLSPDSTDRKPPTYQENLKRYRQIMAEILGESSE